MSQWRYGHTVIVTAVWGLIPPADQVLNDQPTMLKVPFGGMSQHMLDMTMRFLQVCWEGSKIACFILFTFVYGKGFSVLAKNLTVVGLVQPEPAPILV